MSIHAKAYRTKGTYYTHQIAFDMGLDSPIIMSMNQQGGGFYHLTLDPDAAEIPWSDLGKHGGADILASAMLRIADPQTDLDLEAVLHGYLVCALWSSTYSAPEDSEYADEADSNLEDGDPFDDHYSPDDVDQYDRAKAMLDIRAFVNQAGSLLADTSEMRVPAYQDKARGFGIAECIGSDFWLNRNGHGTGFQDRPEIYGEDTADALADIARGFGQVNVDSCGGELSIG